MGRPWTFLIYPLLLCTIHQIRNTTHPKHNNRTSHQSGAPSFVTVCGSTIIPLLSKSNGLPDHYNGFVQLSLIRFYTIKPQHYALPTNALLKTLIACGSIVICKSNWPINPPPQFPRFPPPSIMSISSSSSCQTKIPTCCGPPLPLQIGSRQFIIHLANICS